jgi:N5-(cytidine 5'-diphosphoramidyl)-L-glutamine hydrolase
MTLVGITQRSLPPNGCGERRYALDMRWSAFLAACGLIGVPLPNVPKIAVDSAEAAALRGVILSGGDDLVAYGGTFAQRDETERRLLSWAMARRLPVLGVCRGMQLIVHAFGGRLEPADGHVAARHDVQTADGVRNVNSYHRLAAYAVPPALEVTAWCGDVVEGVRHRDADVLGMMWHAEREDAFDAADVAAFGELFGAAP